MTVCYNYNIDVFLPNCRIMFPFAGPVIFKGLPNVPLLSAQPLENLFHSQY